MPAEPAATASAADFRWDARDPLARALGEPAQANEALRDYAKRIGPDRSVEKLLAFYRRAAAGKPSSEQKAKDKQASPEQPDLFGPLDAEPERQAAALPTLAKLREWHGAYKWPERLEQWLTAQRVVAETGGASESARMFAVVLDSYSEVERAAWAAYQRKNLSSFLRVVIHCNNARRKMLDLDRWAKERRDDRSGDVGQTLLKGIIAAALRFADVIAEAQGEEAADQFLASVRDLCPEELKADVRLGGD
jgi:hypothetical protein